MTQFAPEAASLRSTLTSLRIREPMWSGFQWSCKMCGVHIRQTPLDKITYELKIEAKGCGYRWTFGRI